MSGKAKVLVILGAAAAAAFAFAGSAGASSRKPYTSPVPVPGVDRPWSDVDAALCLCAESDVPVDDVPLCALQRLYPDVPWPSIPADHETVREAERLVRERWTGKGPDELCNIVIDDPDEPVDPDEPDPVDPEDPTRPPIGRLLKPGGGYFWPVSQQDSNLTTIVRQAWGLNSGHPAIYKLLTMVTRSLANLSRYSRRQDGTGYAYVKLDKDWYSIAPAFLPRNASPSYIENNRWPPRTISATGVSQGNGSAYGLLWLPEASLMGDEPVLAGGVLPNELPPDDPRLNPPLEWLAFAVGGSPDDALAVLWSQMLGNTEWRPLTPSATPGIPAQPVYGGVGRMG